MTRTAKPGLCFGSDTRGLAGVVLLDHAQHELVSIVERYVDALSRLYLIDNSPGEHEADLADLIQRPNIVYLPQPSNIGVAAGLNVAVRRAAADRYEWLLTLDQDCHTTPEIVEEMLQAFDEAQDPTVALITPFHTGGRARTPPAEPRFERVDWTMSSGTLVRVPTCMALGGFDAGLFIDNVDHEYCLRLPLHGYHILRANRAILKHEPGRSTRAFFGRFVVSHHDPERHYYKVRNRFVVARAAGTSMLFCSAVSVYEALLVLLYERSRLIKLRMMLLGYRDFRRNRLGRR